MGLETLGVDSLKTTGRVRRKALTCEDQYPIEEVKPLRAREYQDIKTLGDFAEVMNTKFNIYQVLFLILVSP
jgi:hypothetical protein